MNQNSTTSTVLNRTNEAVETFKNTETSKKSIREEAFKELVVSLVPAIQELAQDSSKTKEELKDIKKEQDRNRISVIESIGIFVALFTFISISFQVFNSYRDPWTISGLLIILLGSISFFLSLFNIFIFGYNSVIEGDNKKQFYLSISSEKMIIIFLELFLIGVGVFLFTQSKIENFEDESKRIENNLVKNIESEFKKNEEIQKSINDKNQKTLECLKNRRYIDPSCF